MATIADKSARETPPLRDGGAEIAIFRHRISTRLWHWVNALAFFMMVMSGLMIFNACARLYWGRYGANFDHSWLEIGSRNHRGFLRIANAVYSACGKRIRDFPITLDKLL